MLLVSVGGFRFRIPEPTQLVGSPFEVGTGHGRVVTRRATVTARPDDATLHFEEVPGGWAKNGPFGGALTTKVKFRRAVSTAQQAKTDFFSDNTSKVRQAFDQHPSAVKTTQFPKLKIVAFDFNAAGWEPGNCVAYAVLNDAAGAVVFDPTHYLNFDWARLEVELTSK